MKKRVLTIIAVFALITALPVAAQTTDASGEERTNPSADAITGPSGLTITGDVESWDGEQLRLNTTTGIKAIQVTERTDKPANLSQGDKVHVDYTRTSTGVLIAREIRLEGEAVEVATSSYAQETEQEMAQQDSGQEMTQEESADVSAQATAKASVESDRMESSDTMTAEASDSEQTQVASNELPQTGSELPLIALTGLIALVGAAGVRFLIS